MFFLPSIDILILGLVAASNMLLGFIIYYSNTKSVTRKNFLLLTSAITLFSVLTHIAYRTHEPATALFVLRFVMFFAVMHAMFFYLLVLNYPHDHDKTDPKKHRRAYILGLITAILTLSPWVFASVSIDPVTTAPVATPGPAMLLFALTTMYFDLAGLVLLIRKTLKAEPENKAKYKLLLYGFLLMKPAVIVFNFVLPVAANETSVIPYSILFSLPFVLFTSYAIIRYRLLDIKLIATEVFVSLLTLVMLTQVLFADNFAATVFSMSLFVLMLCFSLLLIRNIRIENLQKIELQNLSEQLTKANGELKQINEAKTEFLSVASHQLRTPLTAIKGYSSMLLEGDFGALNPEQNKTAKLIFDSSQRLSVLVADLLDMSRIESGRMEFDFTAVDLCKIVDSVIEEVTPKAKDKGLYLYFDNVHKACPEIRADEEKLRQLVINLIDNAIKYTVHGGVTIRLHQTGSELKFAVADTGIGIKPEDQPRMYEKFFRAESASKLTREGTGLGIYVVKKMAEAHGGKVWFESAGENKGTTFFVTFPIPDGPIKEERIKIASLEAF
jgi:signal transduction histidine kinase